ncbi:MAG: filamin/ABP280 repeat domain-containing protein [Longimicrobiales bacterium]
MKKRYLTPAVALGVVALAYACTIRDITEVPVASIEVQPSSLTVLEGESQNLTARVMDEFGNTLPDGAVTWSSDDPTVFSIDGSGKGTALAPGQATVWATLSGTRGSGTVSVEPGPKFVVSEPSILFLRALGGADPEPVPLRITNGGGGSLGGISAAVQYPEGGADGWLSLALEGISAPATLIVTGLLGPLGEGIHDATLVLTSQDNRVAPLSVPIQAVITLDTPIIELSSTALEFQVDAADAPPTPQTIQVTNRGGGVLSDLKAMSLYPGDGGWLSANLTGTTAPTELLVQPDPSGLGPGVYVAEVRLSGPGALNTPVSVNIAFTVRVGPLSPVHCTGFVADGTSGEATNIVVQARDKGGNPLTSGGATVVVTVSGANNAGALDVTDLDNGTYTASYSPVAAGTDYIAIAVDGTPIGGSPFSSRIGVGEVSPARSTATVPTGEVGSPTHIVVQARDGNGNPLSSGGAEVLVTVSGANAEEPFEADDEDDGTYTADYTPTVGGTDTVSITMDGTPISGSPYTSRVDGASPAHSTATVPDGKVKEPTNIVVQARNVYGNPVTVGGETVVVTVSGTNTAGPITATDVGDGTYTASYTPHPVRTGKDYVEITMNGTPISGSPYTSTITR